MNIDQDSQFTARAFTDAVLGRQLWLSVGGNGAWRDNVFVERTWRSIKYEEVHLKAYESVGHARCSIGEYINLYNRKRRIRAWRTRRRTRHASRRCLRSNRQHDCVGCST
ncbi:integrase core domain-containing protein [Burkholderia pseudomallei]|uniref:integrase core domain-containing protein n=1 Tax=Burkholderia pseudomallei TaxID=28450 RepID=UPI000BA7F6EA